MCVAADRASSRTARHLSGDHRSCTPFYCNDIVSLIPIVVYASSAFDGETPANGYISSLVQPAFNHIKREIRGGARATRPGSRIRHERVFQCFLALGLVVGNSKDRQAMRPEADNTDWLKTAAIALAAIDHFAIYFVSAQPLQDWLEVIGRLAAPIFFFLIGFATSRTVPGRWLALGAILMVFDAWGDNWSWGAGSILFSFALFRYVRPTFARLAHASMVGSLVLVAIISFAGAIYYTSKILDTLALYGASGWLWALLGLYQREYIDAGASEQRRFELLRWLISPLTVALFWLQIAQSYKEFTTVQMTILAVSFGILAFILLQFKRGVSSWQPGVAGATVLKFTGHRTLEIYAAQLIISPIIVKLWANIVM
jgi:hypothetical protein